MRSIDGVLLWLAAVVPVTMLSSAHAAPSGVEKYAAPGVQVGQLMEGGGAVIVSSLQVLPNHDLLAIAFARQDHAAGLGIKIAGKLAVIGRISKDAGRTWGEAFLILDSPADSSRTVGDPTAVVAGEKVIVIVCMSGPLKPPFEYGDIRFWQVASTDNAATWSTPTEVAIPRARPGVSGRPGVTLSDGTILVPYWWDFMFQTGTNNMSQYGDIPCVSGTMLSRDSGATWELSTDVFGQWSATPGSLRPADEPAIVAVTDRDIFMVLRSAREDGLAEETWSHDGGRTWEQPKPGKLNEFNSPTCLGRMRNGWVVRMWDNSKTSRFPLVVSISQDNCRTWSSPRTVIDFPADSKWPVQASYPCVVETADGALVAIWCHVTPEGQWFWATARFTADWALGK